ncbi:glycolipid transfer protein 1-like [Salvia hispanica]|uniref:glycolipid transfer protein 1-like n=1 Tax=Salvia hispanica TaxID=49212 RepID=UPI00200996EF|nr:glycolipid transfer protein 1-like [Salvia hispanica]
MEESVFTRCLEGIKNVKSEDGDMMTKPFLDVCKLILPILAEVETSTAKSSSSCTSGLLWLIRAMDFIVELFKNLGEHQDWSMSQIYNEAYTKTLKKWHGWIAASSFTVGLTLAPERKKFMEVLGKHGGDINTDMQKFCTEFSPILQKIHRFLASCGLDSMKAL